jgi:hypothetical protein
VRVRNNPEQFASFQEIFLILRLIVAGMGALPWSSASCWCGTS